jgi:hypothetical protein
LALYGTIWPDDPIANLGPVVQSTISAIPGLNFNLLFYFMHFCTSICFNTSEKKTFIDPDKISEEIFPNL